MKNAFSVDLEDWFCVYNLSHVIPRGDWDDCGLRVRESTGRVLDLLEKHQMHATFFVLGYIAERAPDLVREVDARGHEIAVHSYNHLLITKVTPEEFEQDLTKAINAIRQCGVKQELVGFRAPSFTVVDDTKWALEILEKLGIRYDSSIFPVGFHWDYGVADAPLAPYKISERLHEVPLTVVELFGKRFPCSGGGYFRIFPYAYTRYCLRKVSAQRRPVVFYIHPWELDPGQPRMKLPFTKRFRHYYNLHKTEKRLDALLSDFQFTTIREVLAL